MNYCEENSDPNCKISYNGANSISLLAAYEYHYCLTCKAGYKFDTTDQHICIIEDCGLTGIENCVDCSGANKRPLGN